MRASMLSDLLSPLTRRLTLTGRDASCGAGGLAAARPVLAASGATAVPAAPAMNLRRLKPGYRSGIGVVGHDGLRRLMGAAHACASSFEQKQ